MPSLRRRRFQSQSPGRARPGSFISQPRPVASCGPLPYGRRPPIAVGFRRSGYGAIVLLFLGLWAAGACRRAEEKDDAGRAASVTAPRPAVSSATPEPAAGTTIVVPPESPRFQQLRVEGVSERAVVVDEVIAPGRVGVNPNRISRVVPPVQGRVLSVMAKLGDFVEQGQTLVTLESPDAEAAVAAYLQAQAAERQARSALTKAEADYARAKDLYVYKAVAEKDVLSAQNDLAQAKGLLDTALAARQQASRKLEILGLKPNDFGQPTFVRAPISGKVLEINVTPGEYRAAVSFHSDAATAPLMTIADLRTVWISADVPEPSIRLIHVGEEVEITLIAFPGETFSGRVARMADTLDPQTRTLMVHVDLPNPSGRFRPEMFGSIRHAGTVRRLPVVPPAALVQEYGRTVLFVERGPGQFERREVTTGPRFGEAVPILAGVRPGDRVVVDGAVLLKGQ